MGLKSYLPTEDVTVLQTLLVDTSFNP